MSSKEPSAMFALEKRSGKRMAERREVEKRLTLAKTVAVCYNERKRNNLT